MLPVALLSGGLAVRMRPDTISQPKAMLLAAGKPFIEHQLKLLRGKGASRIVLCLGYLGEMIEQFVGDGSRFGLSVSYSYDGEKLIGTGGALKKAARGIDGPFFVLYGDSYLDVDYAKIEEAFLRSGAGYKGLMTVYRNEGRWDSSNVVFEDGEIVRYSKRRHGGDMKYIDYGLGILSAQVFDEFGRDCSLNECAPPQPERALPQPERAPPQPERAPAQPEDAPSQLERDCTTGATVSPAFDLAEVYEKLAEQRLLMGYEVFERFYEIGSTEGLKELEQMIASRS